MTISATRSFVFAAGVLTGILGIEGALHATSALAHAPSMASMSMSKGDTEMMATMKGMQQKMAAMHMTGDQDRDFIMMMIPHHRSAMDMAKIELRRGNRTEVKSLAKDIIASQGGEIEKMKGWLKLWYGVTDTGM